LTSIIEFW